VAQEHPSRLRRSAALPALIYGLAAAPIAWISEQLVSFEVAQRACFPKTTPLDAPAFGGIHLLQSAAILIAVITCASALAVAVLAWRHTRAEHDGGGQTLLAIGEGRSRFMAFAGILTSAGFLVAVLFSTAAVFTVPAC
jgi:hypothetical protein